MRRITLWILATVCGLVLLFSYRTSVIGQSSDSDDSAADQVAGGDAASATASAGDTGGEAAGAEDASGAEATEEPETDGTYDGDAVSTRYGDVQVQVVIANGELVDVIAVAYPNSNRHDEQISDYALPILRDAALAAQGADIESVSGATYTSEGYRTSLQSALDAADFTG